jgi:hypothetical protein
VFKIKTSRKEKMIIIQLAAVKLLAVLMTLVLFSYAGGSFVHLSYAAQQQVGGVGTLEIKASLDKIVVEQGKTQTIHFQVADQRSRIPIGGAITSATIDYADGKTVRHFSMPTDPSGRSSISWKIDRNAPIGRYDVGYSVFETGYVPESFGGGSFSVITRNVNNNCFSSSGSSLIILDTEGSSTHVSSSSSNSHSGSSSSISSQTCRNVSVGPSTHVSSSS